MKAILLSLLLITLATFPLTVLGIMLCWNVLDVHSVFNLDAISLKQAIGVALLREVITFRITYNRGEQ